MLRIISDNGRYLIDINGIVKSVTENELLDFIMNSFVNKSKEYNISSIINSGDTLVSTIAIDAVLSKVTSISVTYMWIDQPIDVVFKYSGNVEKVKGTYPFIIGRVALDNKGSLEVYAGVPNIEFIKKNFDFDSMRFISGFDDLFVFTSDHAGLPFNTYSNGKICIPKTNPIEIFNNVVIGNRVDYELLRKYCENLLFLSDFNYDLNKNTTYAGLLKEYEEKLFYANYKEDKDKLRLEYIEKIYEIRNF